MKIVTHVATLPNKAEDHPDWQRCGRCGELAIPLPEDKTYKPGTAVGVISGLSTPDSSYEIGKHDTNPPCGLLGSAVLTK